MERSGKLAFCALISFSIIATTISVGEGNTADYKYEPPIPLLKCVTEHMFGLHHGRPMMRAFMEQLTGEPSTYIIDLKTGLVRITQQGGAKFAFEHKVVRQGTPLMTQEKGTTTWLLVDQFFAACPTCFTSGFYEIDLGQSDASGERETLPYFIHHSPVGMISGRCEPI